MVVDKDYEKLKVIKDPIYGNIPLSCVDRSIMSSAIFNRLHNIRQNGIAYMVYPGAITTRFLHSVGVMHLATEAFIHAVHNAQYDHLREFLERLKEEIRSILKSNKDYIIDIIESNLDGALKKEFNRIFKREGNKTRVLYSIFCKSKPEELNDDEIILKMFIKSISNYFEKDKFFNLYSPPPQIREKINGELYYLALFSLLSVRLAGLLHDIGHLPFSHCLEDIIEYIYDNLRKKSVDKDKDNIFDEYYKDLDEEIIEELLKILEPYCGGSELKIRKVKKIHEVIGLKIIYILFHELIRKEKILNIDDFSYLFVLLSLQLVIPEILYQSSDDFIALRALCLLYTSPSPRDRG